MAAGGGPTYAITEAVTNIGATTAQANGAAYPGDGMTVTGRGVVMGTSPRTWNTSYPDYFMNQYPAASAGPGQFNVPLTGLTPGQTYYLCAYATDNSQQGSGIYYGGEVSFTVPAAHTSARSDTQAVSDQIRKSPAKRATDATTQSDTARKNAKKQAADTAGQTEVVRRNARKRTAGDETTSDEALRLRPSVKVTDLQEVIEDHRRNLARNPRLISSNGTTPIGGGGYSPGGTGSLSNTDGVQTVNVFSHTGGSSRYGVVLQSAFDFEKADDPFTYYTVSLDLDEVIMDGASKLEIYVELLNGVGGQTQYRSSPHVGDGPGRKYYTMRAGQYPVTRFNVYVFFVLPSGWTGNAKAVIKNLMFERGQIQDSYFDGTTPGASWVGAADYSQSILPITMKTIGKRTADTSPMQEGISRGIVRAVADAVTQTDGMAKRQGYGLRPLEEIHALDGSLRHDTPIGQNLILNPSFEDGTTYDILANMSPSTSAVLTDGGAVGSNYVRRVITVAQTGASNNGLYKNIRIPAEPGDVFWVSYYVRTNKATTFGINFEQLGGTSQYGAGVSIPANTWTRVSTRFVVTTTGSTTIRPAFYSRTGIWDVGDTLDFDGLMITKGDDLYDYGDGDTYAWHWDGVPYRSTSSGPKNAGRMGQPSTNVKTVKDDTAIMSEVRDNILANPSFESANMNGIGAYWNGQVSFDTTEKKRGSRSLKVTSGNTTQANGMIFFAPSGVEYPAGTLMYIQASVKAPVGLPMRISNRLTAGSNLEEAVNINFTGDGEWHTYTLPVWTYNGTNNGGMFRPGLQIRCREARPEAWSFWVDEVILSTSPIVDYFDGDTPGASWAGTAHQSRSTIPALTKIITTPKADTAQLQDANDGINTVPNGDFETPAVGGPAVWPVPSWANTGSAIGVSIDQTGGRGGGRAAKLVVDGANTYIGIGQLQGEALQVEPGKKYTLRLDTRADAVGVAMKYSFAAKIAGTSVLQYLNSNNEWTPTAVDLRIPTTTNWATHQKTVVAPPNAEKLYFTVIKRALLANSTGRTFWVDNVRVSEAGLFKNVATVKTDTVVADESSAIATNKRTRDIAHTSKKHYSFSNKGGITIPNRPEINVGAYDEYTVIFKFRSTALGDQSISEKWTGAGANRYPWAIRGPYAGGTVSAAVYDGESSPSTNNSVSFGYVADGLWHTGVFVRSWLNRRLYSYLDGILKNNSNDPTAGDVSTPRAITIGMRNANFALWTGDISEFILLKDHAMTAAQVATYEATGQLPVVPALHVKMDDNSEWPVVRDLSPSKADGVAVAGAIVLNEEPSDIQRANVTKRTADNQPAVDSIVTRAVMRYLTDTQPVLDTRRLRPVKRLAEGVSALDELRRFIQTNASDTATASDEPVNMIPNGSFELPVSGNWNMGGVGERDTKYAMDGNYSLKMTTTGYWQNTTPVNTINVTEGMRITAQAIVNTEEPHTRRPTAEGGSNNANIRFYYYFYNQAGGIITENEFAVANLTVVRKNHMLKGTRTVPAGAVRMRVLLHQYGIGTAWYDGVALTEGEDTHNWESGKLVSIRKNVGAPKAEVLSALDAIRKAYRKNVANETLTATDVRRIRNVLRKTDTAVLTELIVKRVAKRLIDTTNILDSIRKSPSLLRRDYLTIADEVKKLVTLGIFDSIIMSDIGEDELIRKSYTVLRARAGRGNVTSSDTIKARSKR